MLEAYYSCALEAGTDEAGRGCLAGPVTAAAVILPERFEDPLLNDSKKLSADQRERLAPPWWWACHRLCSITRFSYG